MFLVTITYLVSKIISVTAPLPQFLQQSPVNTTGVHDTENDADRDIKIHRIYNYRYKCIFTTYSSTVLGLSILVLFL